MTDSTIRSYRDLIVWQKGMDFCTDVYTATKAFPKEEFFEAQTQLEIARRLEYISPSVLEPLNALSIEIEKMLNSMISKLAP
jgi:hypothetical protein